MRSKGGLKSKPRRISDEEMGNTAVILLLIDIKRSNTKVSVSGGNNKSNETEKKSTYLNIE